MKRIKDKIYSTESFKRLETSLSTGNVYLSGINGSLISFVVDFCHRKVNPKILFVSDDGDRVGKVKDDLELLSESDNVSVYSSGTSYGDEELSKTLMDLSGSENFIVLSDAKYFGEKVISKEVFKESLVEIKKEQDFSFDSLLEKLNKYNYIEKDFVEEAGDYSVRGGIVDLFPESYITPIRIEFFGDTVESIREFDVTTQRSLKQIESVKIGMNLAVEDPFLEEPGEKAVTDTIMNYLPGDVLVVIDEPETVLNELHAQGFRDELLKKKCLFVTAFASMEFEHPSGEEVKKIKIDSLPQPSFHSNLKQLYNNLSTYDKKGFELDILCSDDYQAKRIRNLIEDFEDDNIYNRDKEIHHSEDSELPAHHLLKGKFDVLPSSIQEGFIFTDGELILYTEHQIFGRYFRQPKRRSRKFKGLSLSELKELQYGDFVVHRDFGIGKYSGLKKIKAGDNIQEVIKLSYGGSDTVFLNLNYIHLIKKYSSTEGFVPKLTKLGGGEWDRVKQKAKSKVKDIARDLILLYAKRKSEKGFKFSSDTHWQSELEASFMYEDTPDQFSATEDFKKDMESENPMDRLICGDVGFGKTEVAVRAVFKAVLDNKQVAVLVPTTILAVQHYNTFRDRLAPFAVEVECISRLQPKKEQKLILDRLERGKVNIIIGTHRILSNDIKFKDLGLLIIDEEQRFGVKAKEKIRSLQPNVDTLTLTATPIPRTLNFSLLGARDMSIINTPPKNRKPIKTEIIKREWSRISGIIKEELERGGQVYFVNNTIGKLYELADEIKKHLPYAKVGIAHGQMDGRELEDVVISFIEKKLNVLVCTKIIESGLDIPNVNTIIINNANMFGLAELYQLRGRVGRSDQQAYAYLISSGGKMTRSAVRRLQAIEEFTELGSGINLAMRDMEIRGVGNLLGKEQSGFVQQIGFEMFMSVIEEAVDELKENEFKELFKEEEKEVKGKSLPGEKKKSLIKKVENPTVIENDFGALIPKDYVINDTERLNIYRRIFEGKVKEELETIKEELKDRFGDYLEDVENLFDLVELKIKATELGLEKINVNRSELSLHFPPGKEHPIFQSDFFGMIIEKISDDKSGKYKIGGDKDALIVDINLDSTDDNKRLIELRNLLFL